MDCIRNGQNVRWTITECACGTRPGNSVTCPVVNCSQFGPNRYSCIDIYSYSCLHPLSNERKSMFKSGDSRAVWTWVWTWKYLKWALHYLHDVIYGTHCGPDWSFRRCFCSRKRCVRLWRNDVRKYTAGAILFREIQCKKMDN